MYITYVGWTCEWTYNSVGSGLEWVMPKNKNPIYIKDPIYLQDILKDTDYTDAVQS